MNISQRSRLRALANLSVYRGKCRCCRACTEVKLAPCNAFKRSNTNFGPTASRSAIWAASPGRAGKHVRAKSGLNKSILDQGWSEFRRQLQYKLDWNGGILVAVPPHND
jgi:transposase